MIRELLTTMKIWTKDPLKRPQIKERIRQLVDDSNKKKMKAAENSLTVNKKMEIMVRQSNSIYFSYLQKYKILYLVVCESIQNQL
jgi:hypothetical protein